MCGVPEACGAHWQVREGRCRNSRLGLPGRACDLSRQMRKPKLGGSKTCEKPLEGCSNQRMLPGGSRRSGFSPGVRSSKVPPHPNNCFRFQRIREGGTKSSLCMYNLHPHPIRRETGWPCSTSEPRAVRPATYARIAAFPNDSIGIPPSLATGPAYCPTEDQLPHLFLPMNYCDYLTSCMGKGPVNPLA